MRCFEFLIELIYWTQAHLKWLKSLELGERDRKTLNEYLIIYKYQTNRIEAFDKGIEELASERVRGESKKADMLSRRADAKGRIRTMKTSTGSPLQKPETAI